MLNRLGLKTKLSLFLGGILALTVMSSAISFFQAGLFTAASERSQILTRALRNHMTADMMHDGLKGVVFNALYAAQTGRDERTAIETDLEEVIEKFRSSIARNMDVDLPEKARAALAEGQQSMGKYIEVAQAIARSSFTNRDHAEALLPDFLEKFEALGHSMKKVSDNIEAAIADQVEMTSKLGRGLTQAIE